MAVSIYKNDLKYLFDEIDKRIKKRITFFKRYGKYEAIETYINDELNELRTKGILKNNQLVSPKANTIKSIKSDLINEATGFEMRYELAKTLDPICWAVEHSDYKSRFIIIDTLKAYLDPTLDSKKVFARFPKSNPSFPATPAQPLNLEIKNLRNEIKEFNNVFLKDESQNITGTHKDRMALEVLSWYQRKEREIMDEGGFKTNPTLSLLTYGCAGMAIQSVLGINTKYLRDYSFQKTNINLLVPDSINPNIEKALKNIGCNVFKKDLTKENLNSKKILELTENNMDHNSYDLTFGNRYDGKEKLDIKDRYYDYLSFEIINTSAKYVFVPYGSGDLYYNLISRIDREINKGRKVDNHPLLMIEPKSLKNIVVIGSMIKRNSDLDNNTINMFDKLYSPYFGENNNLQLCEKIIKDSRVNKNCKVIGLSKKHTKHIEDAIKIMEGNQIDFEYSGLAGLLTFLQMKDELGIQTQDKVLIVSTGKLKYEQFLK